MGAPRRVARRGREPRRRGIRKLAETTGLAPGYLEQLYAFGDLDRSPTRASCRSSTGRWCERTRRADATPRRTSLVRRRRSSRRSPSTTTTSSTTPSGACATSSSTAASRTRSSPRNSRSPSSARCTRRSSADGSIPRTSAVRSRGPAPSSRPMAPHRQPPARPALPLQPGRRARRQRPPRPQLKRHPVTPSTPHPPAATGGRQRRPRDPSDRGRAHPRPRPAAPSSPTGRGTFDARPGYGPGSSMGDVIPTGSPRQGALPEEYRDASEEELARAHPRRQGRRSATGSSSSATSTSVTRSIAHADYVGDSFQLANAAQDRPEAEAIVFCGVHFMAETADMLSRAGPGRHPARTSPPVARWPTWPTSTRSRSAGSSSSRALRRHGCRGCDGRVPVIPVTYMNSSAASRGSAAATAASSAPPRTRETVLEWAFERGQRVLFFPDQHLGRNTAKAMGVPLEQMPMWNPNKPLGGIDRGRARGMPGCILWHGFCSVHKRFTVDQIDKARAEHPGVRVIVHPECPMPVVDAADEAGSTDYIRKAIAGGDRTHDVRDRHRDQPRPPARRRAPAAHDLLPRPGGLPLLDDVPHPPRLPRLGARGARRRRDAQPITVPDDVAATARVALERMLGRQARRRRSMTRTLVVVGSGIAGLIARAPRGARRGHEVTLVTKDGLGQANTRYAQGGIAAVMFAEDCVEAHMRRHPRRGRRAVRPGAVEVLVHEGPGADPRARSRSASPSTAATDGELRAGLEAAHSYPRVLHAGGDATGRGHRGGAASRGCGRSAVAVHEHAFLLDLVIDSRRSRASAWTCSVDDRERRARGSRRRRRARHRRRRTALPPHHQSHRRDRATASPRPPARARLADLEFYQFHPTALARRRSLPRVGGGPRRGRRAASTTHRAALHVRCAPGRRARARATSSPARSRARWQRQGGRPGASRRDRARARRARRGLPCAPASHDRCRRARRGLRLGEDPIPVTPAAHYWMGGVAPISTAARACPVCYAVGEVARTGVHGANRLASNSLLEGAVFGARAGDAIISDLQSGTWPDVGVPVPSA